MTEKPVAEGLPELCFTTLPSTGELICIKRGELGYYPSSWSTGDRERNKELADYNNERLGVTVEQRLAMESGSMGGWDVPGTDPANYENGVFIPPTSEEMSILYCPALMPSVVDYKDGRMMILLFSGSSPGGGMILVQAGNGCLLPVHMRVCWLQARRRCCLYRGY